MSRAGAAGWGRRSAGDGGPRARVLRGRAAAAGSAGLPCLARRGSERAGVAALRRGRGPVAAWGRTAATLCTGLELGAGAGAGTGPGLRGSLSGPGGAEALCPRRWWGEGRLGAPLLRRARSCAGGSGPRGRPERAPASPSAALPGGRSGAAAQSARRFTFGAGVECPTYTWVSYLGLPKNWVCKAALTPGACACKAPSRAVCPGALSGVGVEAGVRRCAASPRPWPSV